MTVAELRAVLATLGSEWNDREVLISSGRGAEHPRRLELQARRHNRKGNEHLIPERLERKLVIRGGRLWMEMPDAWELEGPWPEAAAGIGMETAES